MLVNDQAIDPRQAAQYSPLTLAYLGDCVLNCWSVKNWFFEAMNLMDVFILKPCNMFVPKGNALFLKRFSHI